MHLQWWASSVFSFGDEGVPRAPSIRAGRVVGARTENEVNHGEDESGPSIQPIPINGLSMLSGKEVAGWPSGSSIDSEDTMKFSVLTNVKPRIEKFALDKAEEAFTKVMENRIRFRAVLVP